MKIEGLIRLKGWLAITNEKSANPRNPIFPVICCLFVAIHDEKAAAKEQAVGCLRGAEKEQDLRSGLLRLRTLILTEI